MHDDLPVVVREKVDKALADISEARIVFEQLIAFLETWVSTGVDDTGPESAQSALVAENQRLTAENESLRQELDRVKKEVEKHRNRYIEYQKSVRRVLTERFQETLEQLKLKDPISELRRQHLDLTKRTERDSLEIATLTEREANTNQENAEIRTHNDDLSTQLQTKSGLLERYNQEKVDLLQKHDGELRDLKRQLVKSLISQVGQRYYMPILEYLAGVEEFPAEALAGIGKRLLGHFRSLNLSPLYEVRSRVDINNDNWDQFEIEGDYEPGLIYIVTTPGLKLGEDVLQKPRVKRLSEDTNGQQLDQ